MLSRSIMYLILFTNFEQSVNLLCILIESLFIIGQDCFK